MTLCNPPSARGMWTSNLCLGCAIAIQIHQNRAIRSDQCLVTCLVTFPNRLVRLYFFEEPSHCGVHLHRQTAFSTVLYVQHTHGPGKVLLSRERWQQWRVGAEGDWLSQEGAPALQRPCLPLVLKQQHLQLVS